MSLNDLVAYIRQKQLETEARGFKILSLVVGEEAEKTILAASMRQSHTYVTLPDLMICGIRVVVHKRLPRGQMWFTYSGGLYDRKNWNKMGRKRLG